MEEEKKVSWTANALALVADIYEYLESQSNEETASTYIDALLAFGNALNIKSEHFSYCRNVALQAKGYRCALFRNTYVVIYKENEANVVILGVIHIKRGPAFYQEISE